MNKTVKECKYCGSKGIRKHVFNTPFGANERVACASCGENYNLGYVEKGLNSPKNGFSFLYFASGITAFLIFMWIIFGVLI